jgi:hypothetical protein
MHLSSSPSQNTANLIHPKVHLRSGHFSRLGSTPVTCSALGISVIRQIMQFRVKVALLFLLLYANAISFALAQEKVTSTNGAYRVTHETPDPRYKPIASRLLTPNEGLAILGVALDSRHSHADFSADCSHFVHELYERAGFLYEYASSSDLYEGTNEFRQIASPQPGDLAVWRGHTGIVVNPDQHSFFSALRSGPGVDFYDSPYWKQRGQPRFFRYVEPASGGVNPSIRNTSWQPRGLNDGERYESAPDSRAPAIAEAPSAKLRENKPAKAMAFRVVVLSTARPKSDQVAAAFLQACNESEESLRGRDLIHSAGSFVVFDEFEVKKVHISGNQGWVEVQIDERVSLTDSNPEVLHKGLERQRWSLRRSDNKSWKLTPSRNAIYLPQNTAERLLAHALAQLTENTSNNASGAQDKAELARLLDVLFGK